MLILLFNLLAEVMIGFLATLMVIIIMMIGIAIILSAIGLKVVTAAATINVVSAIGTLLYRAVKFLIKKLIQLLRWVYKRSNRALLARGLSPQKAKFWAIVITVAVAVAII